MQSSVLTLPVMLAAAYIRQDEKEWIPQEGCRKALNILSSLSLSLLILFYSRTPYFLPQNFLLSGSFARSVTFLPALSGWLERR